MDNISPHKQLDQPHRLVLDARGQLGISGIEEIESFDESMVVLHTVRGTLVIHGRDLHLQLLSLDGGQVNIDGTVDSMTYEDESRSTGFFSRLFG